MFPRFLPLLAVVPLCGGLLLGAQSAPAAGEAAREQQDGKAQEEAVRCADEGQWKRVPEGSRPAYAGIQGGTVPVTLLQASNGTIFVIPGRTGNDFNHVLRGTNGTPDNATQAAKPTPQPAAAPTAEAAAVLPQPTPEAQAGQAAPSPQQPEAAPQTQAATPAQPSRAANQTAAPQLEATAHAQAATPTQQPPATTNQDRPTKPEAAAQAQAEPAAQPETAPTTQASGTTEPAPQMESAPQAPAVPPATASTNDPAAVPAQIEAQAQAEPAKPQEDHVVFASSDMAARLRAEAELTPFGLSSDAKEKEVVERQLQPARPDKPVKIVPFKPLRLGSYTLLLSKR